MSHTTIDAANGEVHLGGSVWMPDARSPRALILMYPGSGPADRNNDVFFPPIRGAFLADGYAVASLDKRGVGESTGSWLEASISDQADDLAAFLAAARKVVPAVPVGLFGHSQGGWVVLEAAANAKPDFLITSSGPSVTPRVQEEFSTRARLAGNKDVEAILASFGELFDRAGDSWDDVERWMAEAPRSQHFDELAKVGAFVPDGPELWHFAGLIMNHDPAAALSALTVPLLAVFGGADTVVPVEASAARLRRTVQPALLTVRVINDGDHRVQHPDSEQLLPDYLPTLREFVRGATQGQIV